MNVRELHRWDLSVAEAAAVQRALAGQVEEGPPLDRVETVAAADVSGGRRDEWIAAVVVVMRLADFEVIEVCRAARRATWPYVPGYLSFREVPVVAEALRQVRSAPDVLLCDGQGRAHPRRLGLASHLGLLLDVPTIGCAKSLLVGRAAGRLGRRRGSRTALLDGAEQIGAVLRTRDGVAPVYTSVGHRIDLPSAERWVLAAAPRFRLPEPSRLAHQRATEYKREILARGHP
jgi:deoxyribonuclease V